MNAAGTLGYAPHAKERVDFNRFGAFITNPISLYPRTPAQTRFCQTTPGGLLIHSGYPNPGLRSVIKQTAIRWERSPLPIIVHLLVNRVKDIKEMVSLLEGREGIIGIELGIPPDCQPSEAVQMVEAAIGEMPQIVRVPMERASEFAAALQGSPLAGISLAPPRGTVLDQQSQPISGRLFGPAVFPYALATIQKLLDFGIPVIAAGGIYQQRQIDALLEIGVFGVQLDAVLWNLGDLEDEE
jgi:dihydroorotate dehydrogenase (NAD+) catalytic subunit